ncbi:general transcription factor II-I repeat domain-containing protein 2A [Trichonephila clavipes]|nr:general transcription factor II-I repeat domain-containing protein 2A [Trichonephila clavipes]
MATEEKPIRSRRIQARRLSPYIIRNRQQYKEGQVPSRKTSPRPSKRAVTTEEIQLRDFNKEIVMSGSFPDSPEVEEGSPYGGVECEDSSPEPSQLAAVEYGQPNEENIFPIANVAVELYEDPDENTNTNSEISSEGPKESDEKHEQVERIESTPDVINFQINSEGDGKDVTDSNNQDVSEDSDTFNSNLVKFEQYDPDYKTSSGIKGNHLETTGRHTQRIPVWRQPGYRSHLEFVVERHTMITQASSFDEGSNSNFDDSFREEPKGSPLSRFPKIVKAFEMVEYETLQVLYQLLYQRSAWDTQEILTHGILEFSGFPFSQNSEEYFNREVMLRTQPIDMLMKIGTILGLDQVQKMFVNPERGRNDLIANIMHFLSKPSKRSRSMKPHVEEEKSLATRRPITKCGCRSGCMLRFTKAERQRLLEYAQELDEKKMLESYLLHFMECKKVIRNAEATAIANYKKLKEVVYSYKKYNGSVDMRLLPLWSKRILPGSHVPSLAAPFPIGDIALSFPFETICWGDGTEACNSAFYFTIGHPENELTIAKENPKCCKQTYKTKIEKSEKKK